MAALSALDRRYASPIGPATALALQAVSAAPWMELLYFAPQRSAIYAGSTLKMPKRSERE